MFYKCIELVAVYPSKYKCVNCHVLIGKTDSMKKEFDREVIPSEERLTVHYALMKLCSVQN